LGGEDYSVRDRYLLLADLILLLHALIVLFNVAALPVIWLGYFRNWSFVRNFSFRIGHLLLIGFVVAESFLGAFCPLTTWEDMLLTKAGVGPRYERGYIAHWVHRLMFYEFSETVFTIAYLLFFLLVLLTFIWVKPQMPRWAHRKH
jgi:hypothetical protein